MDAPMTDTRFLSALRRNPSDDAIREAIAIVASQFPRDTAVSAELATILAASGERLRHKSSKREFRSVFWATVVLNVAGYFLASAYIRSLAG
jgi:hypothetical protein